LVSIAIIGLYLWTFLSKNADFSRTIQVNLPALILAGITAFISFVAYIWIPKKSAFLVSLILYLLLATMTALLVIDTGGVSSPFIALLVLVIIFSDIFGLWGLIPILLAISAFTANQYISGSLTIEAMIIIVFSGMIPLVISLLMWYNESEDSSYNFGGDSKSNKNLSSELSEVADKSEVVINAIGDGVMAIDNKGVVQIINPAAQNIIGINKQDAIALNYKSVLHMLNQKNEVIDIANDPIQQALNINQQIRTNDTTILTNSGKKITVSLVISPVGEVGSGIIAVFRDVTKERAEEREQAEFISTASHEMRTPVASIEGYLGLAINPQTATVDERARNFIMKAHEAAEHLGHLFQDLLDISKADDNRLPNKPRIIDIVKFTNDILQGIVPKSKEKGVLLTFNPVQGSNERRHITPVYYVNLDGDHIREVINNLVENAIKYTKATGTVMVDITGSDDRIVISVKDSGIGIPAEDIPHLFQKFYRVDDRNTREIGGTGLGLYLCRRLVEIMGGRIWVESKYNKGSTFFVDLPRISNQEAENQLQQASLDGLAPNQVIQEPSALNIGQPPVQVNPTVQSIPTPVTPETTPDKTVNTVPRGQALTPEQIAQYVAKQHELLSQQNIANQNTEIPPQQPAQPTSVRPQTVSVPSRNNPTQ
jgi:PAS domain S-box-containing protein